MKELIEMIKALPTQKDVKNHWEWKTNRKGDTYCDHEGMVREMVNLDDVIITLKNYSEDAI